MEVREVTNNGSADLSDFITPTHFDNIVLATRNLCSHTANPQNDHLSSFDRPSLALKLGHALKKGAKRNGFAAKRHREQAKLGDVPGVA